MILSSLTSFNFSSAPFVLEIRKDLFTSIMENLKVMPSQMPTRNPNESDGYIALSKRSTQSNKEGRNISSSRVDFSAHGVSQAKVVLTH